MLIVSALPCIILPSHMGLWTVRIKLIFMMVGAISAKYVNMYLFRSFRKRPQNTHYCVVYRISTFTG